MCLRVSIVLCFLLGVSFATVEAQAQCRSYMGGVSSSFISSGGVHRYACCVGYSNTIQGGGSDVPYCGTDGRPKPNYRHRELDSFSCSNVAGCESAANDRGFGLPANVPGLCWSYLDSFINCCEGSRMKRQADDTQYDDMICGLGVSTDGGSGDSNGECESDL